MSAEPNQGPYRPSWPHAEEVEAPGVASYLRWNPYEQDPYHPDPYAPR
jgi:hypothetical protein